MNRILIAAIVIIIAACVGLYFWTEWEIARFDASLPTPPAVEEQQVIDDTVADDTAGDTAGGHWHGDEWHAEPHDGFAPVLEEIDFSVQPTEMTEPPAELAEILATPKFVERLAYLREMERKGFYSSEWVDWEKEGLLIDAEKELLDREYPYWSPDGTETLEEIEKRVIERNQRIANMPQEERLAAAGRLEEHIRKADALAERRKAHAARMPSSVWGGQQ